jgi:hypothetical protein
VPKRAEVHSRRLPTIEVQQPSEPFAPSDLPVRVRRAWRALDELVREALASIHERATFVKVPGPTVVGQFESSASAASETDCELPSKPGPFEQKNCGDEPSTD